MSQERLRLGLVLGWAFRVHGWSVPSDCSKCLGPRLPLSDYPPGISTERGERLVKASNDHSLDDILLWGRIYKFVFLFFFNIFNRHFCNLSYATNLLHNFNSGHLLNIPDIQSWVWG